jgi:hypothetical protein
MRNEIKPTRVGAANEIPRFLHSERTANQMGPTHGVILVRAARVHAEGLRSPRIAAAARNAKTFPDRNSGLAAIHRGTARAAPNGFRSQARVKAEEMMNMAAKTGQGI